MSRSFFVRCVHVVTVVLGTLGPGVASATPPTPAGLVRSAGAQASRRVGGQRLLQRRIVRAQQRLTAAQTHAVAARERLTRAEGVMQENEIGAGAVVHSMGYVYSDYVNARASLQRAGEGVERADQRVENEQARATRLANRRGLPRAVWRAREQAAARLEEARNGAGRTEFERARERLQGAEATGNRGLIDAARDHLASVRTTYVARVADAEAAVQRANGSHD